MSPTALDPAASAAVITQAREGRTPRPLDFPAGLRPRDAAEAYAVQDAVVRARGPIAGWKVGAASPQAQPARAALTRDSVWVAAAGEPVLLAASGFAVMGVEAEWVYELGADLPARATPYSAAEVLAAVVSVRAAIEVCDTRFAAWAQQGEWSRLADQACHGALIVGAGTSDVASVVPLAQAVTLSVNGAVAVQHAPGATRRATRSACWCGWPTKAHAAWADCARGTGSPPGHAPAPCWWRRGPR